MTRGSSDTAPAAGTLLPGAAPWVAPSLLSADFSRLADAVAMVEQGGADCLHLDVMDAHFVPNLTFGPVVIDAVRRCTSLFLDTHLMMTEPHRYLEPFAKAGCDGLTVHVEAYPDPREILREIRGLGLRAGLSLNPPTDVAAVEPFLEEIDLLLVMSVNPGFGGQAFMPEVLAKVERAAGLKREHGLGFALEIDGGIDPGTAGAATAAGAEILVAGSAVFRAPDPAGAIRAIREAGASGRPAGA